MPVHSISVTSNSITICKSSDDCYTMDILGFVGEDNQAKADAMAVFIQENYLDFRQKLNTLPSDDPARIADPGRENFFWDGPGAPGQTDLVSRPVEITIIWTVSEDEVPEAVYVTELKRLGG